MVAGRKSSQLRDARRGGNAWRDRGSGTYRSPKRRPLRRPEEAMAYLSHRVYRTRRKAELVVGSAKEASPTRLCISRTHLDLVPDI
jgi:hypothetical protein